MAKPASSPVIPPMSAPVIPSWKQEPPKASEPVAETAPPQLSDVPASEVPAVNEEKESPE
jgi:hypothetical protein